MTVTRTINADGGDMSDDRLRRSFWDGKYAGGHTPWDLGQVSDAVRRLAQDRFPPGGRVFIPGCGRGYEALFLARQGYKVTAVDIAEAPLHDLRSAARGHNLPLDLVHEDVFSWARKTKERFDVILEQTFLCAIEPVLHADYEAMARRLLKPDGCLMGVFMEVQSDDGPPFNCPPDLVKGIFPKRSWRLDWLDAIPLNPRRPGPEYLAGFTRRRTT